MAPDIKIPKKTLSVCLISAYLLIAAMYTHKTIFVYISFILVSFGIICDKKENKINYLLFFVSWVYVFKINIENQSFYSYLVIIYILISFLNNKKIKALKGFLFSFIILSVYITLVTMVSVNFRILSVFNYICNYGVIFIFILFFKNSSCKNIKNYFAFYVFGILSSGILGFFGQHISNINEYLIKIQSKTTIILDSSLIHRFSGLDLDPNYFSVQLLMAISVMFILMYFNKKNIINLLLLITLIIMGFISLSKMFLLVLAFIIVYVLMAYYRKNFAKASKLLFSITILPIILFFSSFNYLYDAYLQRFFAEGNALADITTGRSSIWILYINNIFGNTKTFIFGNGISNLLNDIGAHNIYLCAWYKMGIIGTVIFLIFIMFCYKQLRLNAAKTSKVKFCDIRLLPLYVTLIANFSLDAVTFNYLQIHILLILLSINYNTSFNKSMGC